MKQHSHALRKTSVFLAAGMGAAVGLSGAPAYAVNGAGGNDISIGHSATELNGKVRLTFHSSGPYQVLWRKGSNLTLLATNASGKLMTYSAGDTCNVVHLINGGIVNVSGGPGKYIKISFLDGGTWKYGWSQIQKVGDVLQFGAWSYNDTGGAIKTLGESVTTRAVPLSNGKNKLFWTNANEDSVARYEVQTKNASGAWTPVSSEAAGAGSYSATVPAGTNCRILVEKVDGATEEIGF